VVPSVCMYDVMCCDVEKLLKGITFKKFYRRMFWLRMSHVFYVDTVNSGKYIRQILQVDQ
jgi:hypothetical protein